MFKNTKKQGDAGLGQAIAYFTGMGYDVAVPLTDSADWDLIVEIEGKLHKVQVKSSGRDEMAFNLNVTGGNKTGNGRTKFAQDQDWDLLFLYHFKSGTGALIPKEDVNVTCQLNLGEKYKQYFIMGDASKDIR